MLLRQIKQLLVKEKIINFQIPLFDSFNCNTNFKEILCYIYYIDYVVQVMRFHLYNFVENISHLIYFSRNS